MWARLRLVPAGLVLLAPALAHATDNTHPRTPVVWDDVACVTLVDRTATPVWNLQYDIPYEDLEIPPAEVDNSRTHQFLAFCEDNSPQDYLPNWITWADVEDAAAQIPDVQVDNYTDDEVLETNTRWADCWWRINADADRRPISFEMAEAGVDWDLSAVPAGVYWIHGYTYEPAFNVWWQRPGFVKVHDGDPHAVGPGVAVTSLEQILYLDQSATIEGCTHALEGSTLDAYWSFVVGEPQWNAFVEDEPVQGESFTLELPAPPELAGESGMIRVDITDPMGRTVTAYQNELVIVLESQDPNGCDESGGGFIAGPGCEDDDGGTADDADSDGGATAGGGTGTGAGETTAGDDATDGPMGDGDDGGDDSSGRGCACRTTPGLGPGLGILLLFAPLAPRRRR